MLRVLGLLRLTRLHLCQHLLQDRQLLLRRRPLLCQRCTLPLKLPLQQQRAVRGNRLLTERADDVFVPVLLVLGDIFSSRPGHSAC